MWVGFIKFLLENFIVIIKALIIIISLLILILLIIGGILDEREQRRKKLKKEIPQSSKEKAINDEEERKLFLLTKFNTFVNKVMPSEVESFVKETYEKILGKNASRYIPKCIKTQKTKKIRPKVTFTDNPISLEI